MSIIKLTQDIKDLKERVAKLEEVCERLEINLIRSRKGRPSRNRMDFMHEAAKMYWESERSRMKQEARKELEQEAKQKKK